MSWKPEIGNKVIDKTTGIEGEVIAITEWKYRSPEIAVVREGVDHNGVPWELHWCDMARVSPQ